MALRASNELRPGRVWGPCSLDAQWTPASGPNAEARTGWHDLCHLWAPLLHVPCQRQVDTAMPRQQSQLLLV